MNIGIVSAREGWRAVLKTLGKIDENPEKIIHQWRAREYWLADTLILLRELDAAGYSLAILSNSWLGLTDAGERSTFPEEIDLFTYILDSSKEGIKKPDPAFYALAEERISVSGGLIFFIDDDAQNLLPARMRGWQTFHYVLGGDKGLRSNEEVRDMLLGKTKGL
jgi:HAD superfamily hydrolase (TIGR01509 family)